MVTYLRRAARECETWRDRSGFPRWDQGAIGIQGAIAEGR